LPISIAALHCDGKFAENKNCCSGKSSFPCAIDVVRYRQVSGLMLLAVGIKQGREWKKYGK
jgi:hypothetical protein